MQTHPGVWSRRLQWVFRKQSPVAAVISMNLKASTITWLLLGRAHQRQPRLRFQAASRGQLLVAMPEITCTWAATEKHPSRPSSSAALFRVVPFTALWPRGLAATILLDASVQRDPARALPTVNYGEHAATILYKTRWAVCRKPFH